MNLSAEPYARPARFGADEWRARVKPARIPSGDRLRYSADEGQS